MIERLKEVSFLYSGGKNITTLEDGKWGDTTPQNSNIKLPQIIPIYLDDLIRFNFVINTLNHHFIKSTLHHKASFVGVIEI